jgi:hypothetical protein
MMEFRSALCAFLIAAAGMLPPDEFAVRIKNDPSLVAPGLGAEGVVLANLSPRFFGTAAGLTASPHGSGTASVRRCLWV